MTDMLPFGRAILASQPFSQLLGAELDAFEPGRAVLSLPLKPDHMQHLGMAHGGVLCYLADNALTYAGGSMLGTACVTLEFKINYIRPAKGDRLVAEATVVNAGKRFAVTECKVTAITDGKAILVASAQGTICKTD